MSAICFDTKVDKEVDETGASWVIITLKGKWYVLQFGFHPNSYLSIPRMS